MIIFPNTLTRYSLASPTLFLEVECAVLVHCFSVSDYSARARYGNYADVGVHYDSHANFPLDCNSLRYCFWRAWGRCGNCLVRRVDCCYVSLCCSRCDGGRFPSCSSPTVWRPAACRCRGSYGVAGRGQGSWRKTWRCRAVMPSGWVRGVEAGDEICCLLKRRK